MKITYYIAPLMLVGALTACDRDNRADSLDETRTGNAATGQQEGAQLRTQTAQADTESRSGSGGAGSGDATGGAGVGSDTDTRGGLYNTPEERGVNDADDLRNEDDDNDDDAQRDRNRDQDRDRGAEE